MLFQKKKKGNFKLENDQYIADHVKLMISSQTANLKEVRCFSGI